MRHSVIREFAKENYGPSYYVVPHGQDSTFQPLALIVKERSAFRGGNRRVVMETLDKYLVEHDNLKSDVRKLIEKHLVRGEERQMDGAATASNQLEVGMNVEDVMAVTAKKNVNYGKLQLGSVQEEFFRDMGLRLILSKAKLDTAKMRPYEKKKAYLITNVVYSSKLEITGDREKTEEVDARVDLSSRFPWFNKMKAGVSVFSKTKAPSALGRQERSPLLFAYAKVKYNPENQSLELKEIVGARIKKVGLGNYEDVVPDTSDNKKGEKYFLSKEFSVFDDLKHYTENNRDAKLQIITEIFQESGSFENTKATFTTLVNLASMAVSKDGKRVAVEVPISSREKNWLRSTGTHLDFHNDKTILQVPCPNKSQVQDFIQIFRIFKNMEKDDWQTFKNFMVNNDVDDAQAHD